MLVIVIFGAIAAWSFKKKLSEKGYPESRAWMFPILTGSIIFFFAYIMNYSAKYWLSEDSGLKLLYPFIVGLIGILMHGFLVAKLWKQIQNLPDRGE